MKLFLAGVLALSAAAQSNLCSVEGRTVDVVTGAPVRKAVVTLIHITGDRGQKIDPLPARSGADGRFAFHDLQPGDYNVSAGARGYIWLEATRSSHRMGTSFSLAPGEMRTDVVLRFTPEAAVSGNVVDDDGDPLEGAHIQLWRVSYRSGKRELEVIFDAKSDTNDHGYYRIPYVRPGHYYLSASFPEMYPGARYSAHDEFRYVRMFFPGVVDDATATPIVVATGADLEGINFKLSPTRTVHVRGQVLDVGSASLSLFPENYGLLNDSQVQNSGIAPDGKFEFNGVLPGNYNLVVHAGGGPPNTMPWVRRALTVGSGGVDGLTIRIPPPSSVVGRVRIEGEGNPDPSQVQVRIRPAYPNTVTPGVNSALLAKDGTFRFAGLAPDRYRVDGGAKTEGYYVKSVRLGDRELAGRILELGGSAEIEVVLGSNMAKVAGRVYLADSHDPAPLVRVVLIPEESDRRSDPMAYHLIETDGSGSFAFNHVVPGRYRAFAWESVDDPEFRYMDPEYIHSVESHGVMLTVAEGGGAAVELIAIADGK